MSLSIVRRWGGFRVHLAPNWALNVLFAAAAVGVVYLLVIPHTAAGYLPIYDLSAVLATIPLVVGTFAIPRHLRLPWTLIMVSQVLMVLGDIAYNQTYGIDPSYKPLAPSDILYIFVYGFRLAGLISFARRRSPQHDYVAWIDAVMISVTVFAFLMVFWSNELTVLFGQGIAEIAQFLVSPAMGLITVALLVRIAMSTNRREPSLLLLTAGQVLIFIADAQHMYNYHLRGENLDNGLIHASWIVGYMLVALGACQPDATFAAMRQHARIDRTGSMFGWFIFAAVIALSVPVIGLIATPPATMDTILRITDIVVISLVLLRAALLLGIVQRQAKELDSLARSDGLTGLANRRTWDYEMDRAVTAAATGGTLWVAIADLDHFKRYNDTYGHAAGDELLAAASAVWADTLPETAFLARYGGEEFGVILPNLTESDVTVILNRMRAVTPEQQTPSIGAAQWQPGETPLEVFRRADLALYEAKRTGRNRVIVHHDNADFLLAESGDDHDPAPDTDADGDLAASASAPAPASSNDPAATPVPTIPTKPGSPAS